MMTNWCPLHTLVRLYTSSWFSGGGPPVIRIRMRVGRGQEGKYNGSRRNEEWPWGFAGRILFRGAAVVDAAAIPDSSHPALQPALYL
jgi:hypothetical protein